MQFGRVTVHRVFVDREPAGRIHQERMILLNGSELDAVNGRLFLACEFAFVRERRLRRLAFCKRFREIERDREILLRTRCGTCRPAPSTMRRDVQRIIQIEGYRRGDFLRDESHLYRGRDGLRFAG